VEFWPTKPIPSASDDNNPATCDETNNYRGCRQPIQSAPGVAYDAGTTATTNPKLRVIFGTGKFDKAGIGTGNDKTDMTKMSIYNLVDEIKSFNCSTVDGERVCQDALPEITGGTYSLEVDATQATALVLGGGTYPHKGFILDGTNFGLTFGEGACQSETDAPYDTDKYRGCTESDPFACDEATKQLVCGDDQTCRDNCMTVTRDKCCDWKKPGTTGGPDCCQGDCTNPVCDTSAPTKCRPCWDCIFDFGIDGERVLGDPLIAYGLAYFTTYIPTTTACSAGGRSWLYVLDYRCKSLAEGQTPLPSGIGRTQISLLHYGAKIDLGTGMASEPVMDSEGNILVQMSDAQLVKIPRPGGGDGGGGGGSFRDIQFKGWDRK
jgi:type IV pilus assembly protein PilY1